MSATTHDFGAGPVPAHQHANGGGWVADAAYIAAHVRVGPRARVAGGTIEGGTIEGDRDVLVLGPVGSENQWVTLARDGETHLLGVGCWHGNTVDELASEVQRRCGDHPDIVAEYAAVEALLRVRLAEWGQAAATKEEQA